MHDNTSGGITSYDCRKLRRGYFAPIPGISEAPPDREISYA
jgi:hypothetical protein